MYQDDKNVEVASEDAAYNLIPQLESLLATMADGYGWPDDVIAQLAISYDDGKLNVTHPESMDKRVDDRDPVTRLGDLDVAAGRQHILPQRDAAVARTYHPPLVWSNTVWSA